MITFECTQLVFILKLCFQLILLQILALGFEIQRNISDSCVEKSVLEIFVIGVEIVCQYASPEQDKV